MEPAYRQAGTPKHMAIPLLDFISVKVPFEMSIINVSHSKDLKKALLQQESLGTRPVLKIFIKKLLFPFWG